MAKSMAPGGGGRFAKLEGELSHKPGIDNPGAVAASIGRKKYGNDKMSSMAAHGKEKKDPQPKGKFHPGAPNPQPAAKPKPSSDFGDALTKAALALPKSGHTASTPPKLGTGLQVRPPRLPRIL